MNGKDPFGVIWHYFQEISVSEKSKVQKNIYSMLPFVKTKRKNKIYYTYICLSLQKETQGNTSENTEDSFLQEWGKWGRKDTEGNVYLL